MGVLCHAATYAGGAPGDGFADFNADLTIALVDSGITAGYGGGNFCPDAPLTRRQMAVLLAKALGLHGPSDAP